MLDTLATTVLHRPYVFAFFLAFLAISLLNRGPARTALFLVCGFTVAWASEFSSIRNGFPYGMYRYRYEAMTGEWILGGVPVWDSLSYAFMAYAAYETAEFFGKSLGPIGLIGPMLMVFLDVIADPLAVRGDRWFLGSIFEYPNGGIYFGVPLSNFAGWFLVALTIFTLYRWGNSFLKTPAPLKAPWLGPAFYVSILFFNLLITFWIGEWLLGLTGLILHLGIGAALSRPFFRKLSLPSSPHR